MPATRPAPSFSALSPVPRSGLSNVSETGLRPTTSLTCLRLVSSYASYQACLTCPSPPVRLPKQLSPGSCSCLAPSHPFGVSRYASLRAQSLSPPAGVSIEDIFPGYLSKWRFVFPPCTCLGLSNRARNVCHGKPPAT